MLNDIKQIIPSSACLKCDICCRYLEEDTPYVPYFLKSECKAVHQKTGELVKVGDVFDRKMPPLPCKDHFACRFFVLEKNSCRIYDLRPFDCRLYPFVVTYDEDFKSVYLALDKKCPYLKGKEDTKEVREYADRIAGVLSSADAVEEMNENKNFILDPEEDLIKLQKLDGISNRLGLSGLGLRKISLRDKDLFDKYFSRPGTKLHSFSFAGIYIWSDVLNILWKEVNNTLCVFAGNNKDYFMLIPPAGYAHTAVHEEVHEALRSLNRGKKTGIRIENIPEELRGVFTSSGFELRECPPEYVYKGSALSGLSAKGLASKKELADEFVAKNNYIFRNIEKSDISGCLALYRQWAKEKIEKAQDDYSRMMLEDSYFAQKRALLNMDGIGLIGKLVEVDGDIRAYTLGYSLNKEVFVVLFETADLAAKGLAQFIFREFSGSVPYNYINTLSDSGIPGLKISKESYLPAAKALVFTAEKR